LNRLRRSREGRLSGLSDLVFSISTIFMIHSHTGLWMSHLPASTAGNSTDQLLKRQKPVRLAKPSNRLFVLSAA
ncbi:MAG: hypothetical protein ACR2PB_11260, partial [Desulfocapsaceae bacterium]